jgi:hypothetical protein
MSKLKELVDRAIEKAKELFAPPAPLPVPVPVRPGGGRPR